MNDDFRDSSLDMFLEDSRLMLDDFEQALLAMAEASHDLETLNSAFRAAHNIKGTAGMFGFERVVEFTHEVEALLDRMRAGTQAIDQPAVQLLLECLDQIELLLHELSDSSQSHLNQQRSQQLMLKLGTLKGGDGNGPEAGHASSGHELPPAQAEWLLGVRFGPDGLGDGHDPLALVRHLGQLGELLAVQGLTDHQVPELAQLDAERCQLGFMLRLRSAASREEIVKAFDFVAHRCVLRLLAAPFELSVLRTQMGEIEPDPARLQTILRDIGAWPQDAGAPVATAATEAQAPTGNGDESGADEDEDDLERLFDACQQAYATAAPAGIAPPASRPEERATAAPAPRTPAERPATARDRKSEESRYIRVPADKLDELISQIGELVIAVSSAQILAEKHKITELSEIAQRLDKLVEGARDHSLKLRMVPVGDTFARFKRIVYDVSRSLGKEAELLISGGETELDKSMVEQLMDPLTHLVRNALDHGLETPDERLAHGKAASGQLQLNAYHDTGAIVIEVSDDGRGLSRERILAKALERGLVARDARLSDEQVWNLVFLPGFSTAEQVTDISGRGVGMDVVRRNIDALRGEVKLFSRQGAGSTVQIRLPLTLAIIDGFLVEVAGSSFVLPLDGVEECIEVPELAGQSLAAANYFERRNSVMPLLCLRRHFKLDGPTSRRNSVVVVRHGSQRVGLLVDRLHGEHQTVIKPLGRLFSRLRSISGSAILGSGSVALILDIAALLADASALHLPAAPSALPATPSSHPERHS
ncbi:chemotaxis protein CheA [Malikia sp.]|uniref:chemotaxis protein CheA n=1 Tax=Malikia sp. TaxID=2070706 RepID=UPI0026287C37|nr:chemotaxis protein CheA [Malikia sp.]MDD2728891.1 chemotaxis protein CheA [Malikia sp.]